MGCMEIVQPGATSHVNFNSSRRERDDMSHTPGEWRYVLGLVRTLQVGGRDFTVARLHSQNPDADGELLARAKRMLEALQILVEYHDQKRSAKCKRIAVNHARALLREIEEE